MPSAAVVSLHYQHLEYPKNPGNHARQLKRVIDNCTTRQRIEAAKKVAAVGSD
jgi:hypothetical protein